MKPFDIEAAKRGEPVVTRNGWPVELVSFDLRAANNIDIAGVKIADNGARIFDAWHADGTYMTNHESVNDLFMATKTVTLYTPIYADERGVYHGTSQLFPLEKSAHDHAAPGYVAVATVTFEV